jgi:hypothetical protein
MILDLADLKRTLQPVFTEQQTNTLATCLYEYYQPIVHQREMAAIRDTLQRVSESQDRLALAQDRTEAQIEKLTGAQGRTDARIERLTEAQERTEARIERLTEAQERTEVGIGELTAAQVRSEARIEQLTTAQQSTDGRIDRLTASQESMRADIEHLAEITKEVVWGIGDLRKQVGGIAHSVGQGLEAYAMERIPALLEQQFGFTTRSSMPEFLGLPGDTSEIDVVYRGTREGRPVVVLCEVKTNITDAEVREFLEIVSRVRPSIAADDVRVLFFGYRAGESARRLITEYDALLAFPRGLVGF